jgi:S-adenosyl methyltransferase
MIVAQDQYNEGAALPYYARSPERIASFYEGLELVPPGVVRVTEWHPEIGPHEMRSSTRSASAGSAASPEPARVAPSRARRRGCRRGTPGR